MGLEKYWFRGIAPGKAKGNSKKSENDNLLLDDRWEIRPARELTGKERSFLRQRAHHIKPVVHIGQNGITENVIKEIRRQLLIHELIKIKWSSLDKENGSKKEQAKELARLVGAHFIKLTGRTVVLYNQKRDE